MGYIQLFTTPVATSFGYMFYKGNRKTIIAPHPSSQKPGGVDIGLATCKRFVEHHNGNIKLYNKKRKVQF